MRRPMKHSLQALILVLLASGWFEPPRDEPPWNETIAVFIDTVNSRWVVSPIDHELPYTAYSGSVPEVDDIINYQAASDPEFESVAEGNGAALPITITVGINTSPIYNISIERAFLEYRVMGETFPNDEHGDPVIWKTLDPQYERRGDEDGLDMEGFQQFFGRGAITKNMTNIAPGRSVLVRLYVQHFTEPEGFYELGPYDENPGPDGSAKWHDEQVVLITIADTQHEPHRPYDPRDVHRNDQ